MPAAAQTLEKTSSPTKSQPVKFTVERAPLLRSLGHVQSVVEKRGTIAVLSNVKIEAKADGIELTATDMDIAIVEKVPANVSKQGATTVPAHMLYDIVRKLPDGAEIECAVGEDGGKMTIRCGQSRFSLGCLPIEDFPVMSDDDLTHSFSIKSAECMALVSKPSFAMSNEETRYYLNGIYLHATGSGANKVLRAVATDGHRLARIEVALPAGANGMPGVIVPRKAIHEVRKLLEGAEGDVEVSLSDTKIRFVFGSAVLVSKLIDGNFPDYERVIPSGNDKILEADCKLLAQAVDRVSVISSEKSRAIKLHIENGKLTLSATSSEHGTASEEIDVTYSSNSLDIGFNSRYMLEMMSQIEGDTAQFLLNDGASPAIVRDTADVGSLYVIMPMRV
ncbi:MAG: DNA polymerase III subunit beta [Rickettsiales bacterium]|jgi:DNA polymerase-3 subunit beta|nr:DNA polymerase III subunit beta [Rickettsiales bacterium]